MNLFSMAVSFLFKHQIGALVGGAGLIATIAFGSGWKVNGWRLDEKIADLDLELAQTEMQLANCNTDKKGLQSALDIQNNAVALLKSDSDNRAAAAREALKEARRQSASLEQQIESVRQSRGESCSDAEQLINEALGL